MRASEFINVTEGKASDWFGKAVGKLEQNDINARIKKVLPSIVSTIRDDIAEKVNKILQDKSKSDGTKSQLILKIVPHIIGSLLKTKLGKEDDADLHTILKSIQSDPTGIAHNETISLALQKIAVRMFKDPEFFDTDDKKKDKDDDKKKDDDDEQAADVKTDDEQAPIEQDSDVIERVKRDLKDNIISHRYAFLNDRERGSKYIQRELDDNREALQQVGIETEEDMADIIDELMADKEMPWNYRLPDEFTEEVFAPTSFRGGNPVYIYRDDMIQQFMVGNARSWRYLGIIVDREEIESLKIIFKNIDHRRLLDFKKDKNGYYKVSLRK